MTFTEQEPIDEGLRKPWLHRNRPVPRVILQPIAQFLRREIAGGVLLLVGALIALVWANSPWGASYDSIWHTEIVLSIGTFEIAEDLRGWVNDLLMALFFYVVGLEIKRELTVGELRDPKAAALPVFAAIGGMVVPAVIYLSFNAGGPGGHGWGIPMATDIAFAVGLLSLFSRRIPYGLILFLLALAIADDVGAIAVIAIFYTEQLNLVSLGIAAGLLAAMVGMVRVGIRAGYVYVGMAVAVWLAMFESGVHATIAGVALGFVTPVRAFQRPRAVSAAVRRIASATENGTVDGQRERHVGEWLMLARLSRQAISPLSRNQELLHPWTSYLVLPLFAIANAGVNIGDAVGAGIGAVTAGTALGLLFGKAIGIFSASWIAVKSGVAQLPRSVTWHHVFGVALVGGVGFTVALFVTNLAFDSPELLSQGKIGVLMGSAVAAIAGFLWLTFTTRDHTAGDSLADAMSGTVQTIDTPPVTEPPQR